MSDGQAAAPRGASTRSLRAGLPAAEQGMPLLGGPVLAGPFHLHGDPADSPYFYTRGGNPTFAAYEAALGELEGGEALLFGSGMAAESAILLTLEPGAVLVAPRDAYFGIGQIADHLRPRGIEVRMVDNDPAAYRDAMDGATMVWVETPSNPHLHVLGVAELAEAAHAAGAELVVDNTLATPLGQDVLGLGADLSIVSGSKALTGHHDLIIGYVAARAPERIAPLRAWRTLTGGIAGPFEAWLAHRSLATLGLRLERCSANALALAELLAGIDGVTDVRHPLWPGDPGHATAKAQMRAGGPLVCFSLPDGDTVQRFLLASELVTEMTSFGGIHTSAERRGRWGTDRIDEGFVRFSAGIEDTEDLLADVAAALDAVLR